MRLEGARRCDQQQQPADDATKNRYDAEPTQPCGLTTELRVSSPALTRRC